MAGKSLCVCMCVSKGPHARDASASGPRREVLAACMHLCRQKGGMPPARVFLEPCVGASGSAVDARPAERGAAGARLRLKPQLRRQLPPQLEPQLRRQPLHQPRLPDTPACSRRARAGVVSASASASAFTSALASPSASAFAAAAALASTARPRPQSQRSKHAEQFHVLLRTAPPPEVPNGLLQARAPGPSRNFSSGFHLSFSLRFGVSLCISLDSQTP